MSEEIGLAGDFRKVAEVARILSNRSLQVAACYFSGDEIGVDLGVGKKVASLRGLIEETEFVIAFVNSGDEALEWFSESRLLSDEAANKLLVLWSSIGLELRSELERLSNKVGASLVFAEPEVGDEWASSIVCIGQRGALRRSENVLELLSSEIRYA